MNERYEGIEKLAELLSPFVPALVTGVTGLTVATALSYFARGPAGKLGVIAVMGLTGLMGSFMTENVLERFFTALYCEARHSEPHDKLLSEIESYWEFTGVFEFAKLWIDAEAVKQRLKAVVTDGCGCSTRTDTELTGETREVVAILDRVPGVTKASLRDFRHSQPLFQLRDGTTVRTWKNLVGVDHVFLADRNNRMLYGGFVSWIHSKGLHQVFTQIQRDFT